MNTSAPPQSDGSTSQQNFLLPSKKKNGRAQKLKNEASSDGAAGGGV